MVKDKESTEAAVIFAWADGRLRHKGRSLAPVRAVPDPALRRAELCYERGKRMTGNFWLIKPHYGLTGKAGSGKDCEKSVNFDGNEGEGEHEMDKRGKMEKTPLTVPEALIRRKRGADEGKRGLMKRSNRLIFDLQSIEVVDEA